MVKMVKMVRMVKTITKIKNKYEKIIDFGSIGADKCRLLRTKESVGKESQKFNER